MLQADNSSAVADLTTESVPQRRYVVDSSALIDGRLPDIWQAGFIDGILIVPDFVLRELQGVVADPSKSKRGQRGMLALQRLTASGGVSFSNVDFAHLVSVDDRILALAERLGAAVITSDGRLGSAAHVRGIAVLNLYRLAYIMQPLVSPGQRIRLLIAQPGRRPGQGIGFLDNGMPIVVAGGQYLIGQIAEVIVENVRVNPTGGICFARLTQVAITDSIHRSTQG